MKLAKFFSNTIGYILSIVIVIIVLIGLTFVSKGILGSFSNYNLLFIGIEILILLPIIIWFQIIEIKYKRIKKLEKLENQRLIKTGNKVIVDLENLKIKTNSWNQEILINEDSKHEKVEYVDVNYNYIEFEIPYQDQKINYNLHIDMDPIKLKMHFAIKKSTYLYVDPNDIAKHYLDLEFLK